MEPEDDPELDALQEVATEFQLLAERALEGHKEEFAGVAAIGSALLLSQRAVCKRLNTLIAIHDPRVPERPQQHR